MCRHLEALLPSLSSGKNGRISYTDGIDQKSAEQGDEHVEFDETKFAADLRALGLKPYQVDILVARFLDGQPFDDIVEQQGWTSKGALAHQYQKVLKYLRKIYEA